MLLKNEGQVLPLKKGGNVAVLGPHSDGHDVFLSSKHREPSLEHQEGTVLILAEHTAWFEACSESSLLSKSSSGGCAQITTARAA